MDLNKVLHHKKGVATLGSMIFNGNIFIHIPKCAGMTIWYNFNPIRPVPIFGDQHASVSDYIDRKGLDYLNEHNPCSIVRNPFDRLVSWYFFHKYHSPQIQNNKEWKEMYAPDFGEWVTQGARNHWEGRPSMRGGSVWDQSSMLKYKGELMIDTNRILKVEEISKYLPRSNSSKRDRDYKKYYTEDVLDIAKEICKEDMKNFDYEF